MRSWETARHHADALMLFGASKRGGVSRSSGSADHTRRSGISDRCQTQQAPGGEPAPVSPPIPALPGKNQAELLGVMLSPRRPTANQALPDPRGTATALVSRRSC